MTSNAGPRGDRYLLIVRKLERAKGFEPSTPTLATVKSQILVSIIKGLEVLACSTH